jgi:ligand-binding SRPBCC domain-containing protein
MAKRYSLTRVQLIPAPRDEVFAFFSLAQNLELLTPEFLKFRIVTPLPIAMGEGALIEYRIGLGGVPMRWLTEIQEWVPGERFVDEQRRGPYRYWHHLHEFKDVARGTEMRDRVDYELPFGPLGRLAHALAIERTLNKIFDHRTAAVERAFPNTQARPAA